MDRLGFRAVQLSAILAISITAAQGCNYNERTVQDAVKRASVIFRGTVTAIKAASKPYPWKTHYPQRTMVFHVTRVWKGEVGGILEMQALPEDGGCWGFAPQFLKPSAELLVYTFRIEGNLYTGICSRTQFVRYASEDLKELGQGRFPSP
jgi:hypothetical protein